MAQLDFKGWPSDQQKDLKPVDRLMPFHRIRVPAPHIILPVGPTPQNPNAPIRERVISGDGYSVGARSTKDYDAKFGEDLGKELADVVENIVKPLQAIGAVSKGVSKALAALIRLIPGQTSKQVADVIDDFDPTVELFKFIGRNIDALLVDSLVRSVPAWVPTFDDTLHPKIQILEVDGILIRSHQRIDSLPFWQWHRWYDWHFAVCPSPIFSEIVGFGNTHRDDDNSLGAPAGSNLTNYHKEGLPIGATVSANAIADCEWDIGALGVRTAAASPGLDNEDRFPVFFDQLRPRVKHDWCWPMAGMFFWAIGRSVYDCSHATRNNGSRVARKDRKAQGTRFTEAERLERGVHLNQLRPLKAIATARWEAFQFKENPKPAPAIQFMFYANVHLSSAGFFDKDNDHRPGFDPLGTEDYEFIVDLPPPVVTSKSEYPVGHTPDFALNTLVLQPRIVVNADFAPFQKDGAGGTADGVVEDSDDRDANELTVAKGPVPVVELFGSAPNEPPRQALVRIPLKGAVSADLNAYGVLLSIGWLDPDGISASKVKKVTVRLKSLQPASPDTGEEWNINAGVNGRWFNFRFKIEKGNNRIDLEKISSGPIQVDMFLAVEDQILVAAHGFEEDPFDDLIRLKPEFPSSEKRPAKKAPALPKPADVLDDPGKLQKFKTDALERRKVLSDRILRDSQEVNVPSGKPDKSGNVPTTKVVVPMVGDEIEWNDAVDTDDNHRASLTARAMFLRFAIGNLFDANDLLGMLDPNQPDPAHKDPPSPRSQDSTDTPNPLVVGDVLKEVGSGKTKQCQVSAYKSEVVGRMGTMAYDPQKLDYTLFNEVTDEDLPVDKK